MTGGGIGGHCGGGGGGSAGASAGGAGSASAGGSGCGGLKRLGGMKGIASLGSTKSESSFEESSD